jgi:hypothetical protein
MRRTALIALLAWVGLVACAPYRQPATVPVYGGEEDLQILAGEWRGDYANSEGRSGTISFSLRAEDGTARGDVLMIPTRIADPTGAGVAEPVEEGAAPGSRHLHIEFVRVSAEEHRVTGNLEPYIDPLCDCVVSTVFDGRVFEDRIAGTFVTRRGEGIPTVGGKWRVEREK